LKGNQIVGRPEMAGISWQSKDKRRRSEARMPLSFLMRLLHARLPVRFANPKDIRHCDRRCQSAMVGPLACRVTVT
jgi:hypothetical protein